MTGKELAEYCEKMDCDRCEHVKECEAFGKALSDHSPFLLLYPEKMEQVRKKLLEKEFW